MRRCNAVLWPGVSQYTLRHNPYILPPDYEILNFIFSHFPATSEGYEYRTKHSYKNSKHSVSYHIAN